MPASVLADTGALVAYLDRRDRWHTRCRATFEQLRLPLATSLAVLTELFHLLDDAEVDAATRFIRSGAISVLSIDDNDVADILRLMHTYRDRPMDLADATLVHLARRESMTTVFTVDYDDFETYRIDGRRRFRIVPARE